MTAWLAGANSEPEPGAFDVVGFCRWHNIPVSMYYKLKRQGCAPVEMQVGRRNLITRESAAEWRAKMDGRAA